MSRRPPDDGARLFLRRLGSTLAEIRREQGLLQEHVGVRAGFAGARVGEIERATADTGITRIRAIAAALAVPLSRLFRRMEAAGLDAPTVDAMRARLRAAVGRVPPAHLSTVIAVVTRFAEPPARTDGAK